MKKRWIIAGLLFFLCMGAWGQTYTWTGTANTDWNNQANWTVTGGAPGAVGPYAAPGDLVINGAQRLPAQNIPDPLTVTGDMTITGGTGPLVLPGALTVTGNADIRTALNADTVSVTGTTTLNASVTTTAGGGQTYAGAVTLGANVNLTGNAGSTVRFGGTVNGAFTLTVTTADARFEGVVGGTAPLAGIDAAGNAFFGAMINAGSVNVDGTTGLNAGVTTTAGGGQTYAGAVTLGANVNLTGNAGSTVRFGNTVNGAFTLTVTTADARFEGVVGGTAPLAGIDAAGNAFFGAMINAGSVNVDGTTSLNAGVTTTAGGGQTYGGAVTLGANVTLTGAASSQIRFGGTVNGTFTLRVADADAQFDDVVGGANRLAGITATGNAVFDAAVNADAVSVGTVNAGGDAEFNAPMNAVSVVVYGTAFAGANISTTTGNQNYNGPVILTNNVDFIGGGTNTVYFLDTVAGQGSPRTLTVTSAAARFDGLVNGNIQSVEVSGGSTINANITTAGTQTYNGTVTLGGGAATDIRILTGSLVTLGTITNGNGRGLTITGNGELNGSANNANIGAVSISQNASFETNPFYAASVNVDGTAAIAANITTTDAQNYGAVTLTGTLRTLTSDGSITVTGVVSGSAELIVNASRGISIANANNALTGSVTLNNTRGTAAGEVLFRNGSPLAIAGSNSAEPDPDTDPDGGLFTVDTAAANADITINNPLNSDRLVLLAGTGKAVINGVVTVRNDTDREGHDQNTAAVYISAVTLEGNAAGEFRLRLASSAEVCVNIDSTPAFDTGKVFVGTVSAPERIHYHSRTGDIVYRSGADTPGAIFDSAGAVLAAGTYLYFDSDEVRGYAFFSAPNKNIYIIDTGDLDTPAPSRFNIFTVNGSGVIEIRGEYKASALTLVPGTGSVAVRLANSDSVPINPAIIDLDGGFVLPPASVLELNMGAGTTGPAQIITRDTNGIDLGNITRAAASSYHDLTFNSAYSFIVRGTIGDSTNRLGSVVIPASFTVPATATATFENDVFAASFTQNAGSAGFAAGAVQNYTGAFSFTGAALTLGNNAALTSGAAVDIANTGTFTQSAGATVSAANGFTQTNTGPSDLSAGITVTGSGNIKFAGPVRLRGAAARLDTSANNGNISFASTVDGTGTGTPPLPAGALTLAAGTGAIDFSATVGAAAPPGNIVVSGAGNVTFQGTVHAASFTQSAGTGSTVFMAAQIYDGVSNGHAFHFTGSNLTVSGSLTTTASGTGGAAGGPVLVNAGAGYIQTGEVSSTGAFTQIGVITTALHSDITVTNTTKANARIGFEGPLELKAGLTLSVPATGGTVELKAGQTVHAIAPGDPDAYVLSLAGGSAATSMDISRNSGTLNDVIIAADSYAAVPSGVTVPQAAGRTLTLQAGAALDTSAGSWLMGDTTAPGSADTVFSWTNGFAGMNGTLILEANTEANTEIVTRDFYNASGHTVTLNGANTITASRHVTSNKTFVPGTGLTLRDSTLVMTGTGAVPGELRVLNDTVVNDYIYNPPVPLPPDLPEPVRRYTLPLVSIGNLTVNGRASVNSNIYIRGDVTIENGSILETSSVDPIPTDPTPIQIFVFPPSQTALGNTWNQNLTGKFIPGTAWVEFGNCLDDDPLTGAKFFREHEYSIIGDTTWYGLVCHENGAKLMFSNFGNGVYPPYPPPGAGTVSGTFGHIVMHMLEVFPNDMIPGPNKRDNFITLTRLDTYAPETELDTTYYEYFWMPPDDPTRFFWYFTLESAGKMNINYTAINYSFSSVKMPVPIAGTVPLWDVVAWPYVMIDDGYDENNIWYDPVPPVARHDVVIAGEPPTGNYYYTRDDRNCFNVDWFVFNKFFYAFAEDSNHNGRIDRIRLQSAFRLNGNFSDFEARVYNEVTGESYQIDTGKGERFPGADNGGGYARVQRDDALGNLDMDSLYIYLVEKPYADTGADLYWNIERNTSLMDFDGKTIVGNPRGPTMDEGSVTNTVPPRITHSLALPGHNEIYVQFAGPVDDIENKLTVSGVSTLVPPIKPLSQNEMLIRLTDNLSLDDLSDGLNTFTLTGLQDNSLPAINQRTPASDRPFWFMYPDPKYPQDYNYEYKIDGITYQRYLPLGGDPFDLSFNPQPVLPEGKVPFYPPNKAYDIVTGAAALTVTHRVTDMLVSVPPGASHTDSFFVWPVWARYDDTTGNPGSGFFGQTPDDAGIIWEFNGTKFLEARDVTMQVNRPSSLTTVVPEIVFAWNVPSRFRGVPMDARGYGQGNNGLWVPQSVNDPPTPPNSEDSPPFTNLAPYFYPSSNYALKPPDTSAAPLFTYRFSAADGFTSGRTMDFFFHLDGSGADDDDLFIGRLDISPSQAIPGDWYRRVRPFSFAVHDVTLQRSGVTILNNVINPSGGESTYVDYRLAKPGQVTIQVFTLDGDMVNILYRGHRDAGEYRAAWNGTNRAGRVVARGMYFIRIVGPDMDEIRKVMVIR